jgi:hypothetical protein
MNPADAPPEAHQIGGVDIDGAGALRELSDCVELLRSRQMPVDLTPCAAPQPGSGEWRGELAGGVGGDGVDADS